MAEPHAVQSNVGSYLRARLEEQQIKCETGKEIADIPVDLYVKARFLANVAVLCVESVSESVLKTVSHILERLPFACERLLVVIDSLSDKDFEFWSDVLSLMVRKQKKVSFWVVDKGCKIGQIPEPIANVIEEIAKTGPGYMLTDHPFPSVNASPRDLVDSILDTWIQHVRDRFIKFAVSSGHGRPEQRHFNPVSIDVFDKHGFVFVPEVTDEILDLTMQIVAEQKDWLPAISLIGCIATTDILNRGGASVAIYALHHNYRWRSADSGDTSRLFEQFLKKYAEIPLAKYKRPGSAPWWIVLPAALLTAIAVGASIPYLAEWQDLDLLTIAGVLALMLGALSGRLFGVGKHEYTPAIAYAGLFGALVATATGVATYFQAPHFPPLFYFMEAVIIVDVSLLGGFLYAALTSTPPTYVKPLPEAYRDQPAGTDLSIIRTAITCWDRGWALTMPNMGDLVNISNAVAMRGYTALLDTLFEERYVTVGEKAGRYGRGWRIEDAVDFVAERRWNYWFDPSPRFDKFHDSMPFTQMSESSTCSDCGGKGKVKCSDCGGSGIEYYTETEYYDDDDGTLGSRTVTESRSCSTCNGSGRVTCSRCDGTGWITEYPILICARSHEQSKDCVDPTTGTGLTKVIYQSKGRRLLETPLLDQAIEIETLLPADVPHEAETLAIELGKRVTSQQSERLHIVRQRLRIAEVPITEVNYEYKEKAFRLWVYGTDNDVHAIKAPFIALRLYSTILIAVACLAANIAILVMAYLQR